MSKMKITVSENKKNEGRTIQSWFEFRNAVGNSEFDLPSVEKLLRDRLGASVRIDSQMQGHNWIVTVVGKQLTPNNIRWALDCLPVFESCAINEPAYI